MEGNINKDSYPTVYYCTNSYGIDHEMTDCVHDMFPCQGRKCEKFVRREIPKTEDEKMLQILEWGI